MSSLNYGRTTILGRRELAAALNDLPAKVVKKIMDVWVMRQAKAVADAAKRSAPRDRSPRRRKPESARLWRAIRASRVRNLKKFPGYMSRAIAFGAKAPNLRVQMARQAARQAKGNSRRTKSAAHTVIAPRARHFHLVVLGTADEGATNRKQRTTGRNTGRTKPNNFFARAAAGIVNSAGGEVGSMLKDAYDKGIQSEIKRLARRYS
jgi:hypothetical protein